MFHLSILGLVPVPSMVKVGQNHLCVMTRPSITHHMCERREVAQKLFEDLNAVRKLRPTAPTPAVQRSLWVAAGLDPVYKVSGIRSGEPSFTRLFDHKDWKAYTGKPPLRRWIRTIWTWPQSTVLRALWPISFIASLWAFTVCSLPPHLVRPLDSHSRSPISTLYPRLLISTHHPPSTIRFQGAARYRWDSLAKLSVCCSSSALRTRTLGWRKRALSGAEVTTSRNCQYPYQPSQIT